MNILASDTITSIDELTNFFNLNLTEFVRKKTNELINRLLNDEIVSFFEEQLLNGTKDDNRRNGYYSRLINTDIGPMEISVPRDRLNRFETKILEPYRHRTMSLNQTIQSYYMKGLTLNEISSLIQENLSLNVSKETIRKTVNETLKSTEEFNKRSLVNCPFIYLDGTYMSFKRQYSDNSATVEKECCMVALGVRNDGKREVLGFYFIPEEGAHAWEDVLSDLKSRGINNPSLFITDGLQGMPEAISKIYPEAKHQTCLVHVSRNIVRNARKSDQKEIADDFKKVYAEDITSLESARNKLNEFINKWSKPYPRYMKILSERKDLFTYFSYPLAIRKQLYTSNPIESYNSKLKRETKKRIQFNSEDNALINITQTCIDYNKKAKMIRELQNIDEKTRTDLGFISLDKE